MVTMNISLPEGLKEFVEKEMAEGGYSTASEYIRQLIREVQKRKSEDHLESLLLAGLDSGKALELTPKELGKIRQKIQSRRPKRKQGR
jgi:antitoxin ParD1/3/4